MNSLPRPLLFVEPKVIGARYQSRDFGGESRPEEPVNSNTFHQADWLHQERASQLDRTGAGTALPLAAAVGLTAALLGSLGLWWGIWSAASSLVSALW